MLLYNAQEPTEFESYQERGDIGFTDVAGAQINTFMYEDLSVSSKSNLSRELMKEVHKVRQSAPELFTDHYQGYVLSIEPQSMANLAHPDIASSGEYEAIVEPNLEALKKQFPDANIRNRDEIDADIAKQAKVYRDEFEEIYAYADPYSAFFGTLGGAVVGSMADPINIMAMPLGVGKVAAGGFLKTLGVVAARSFGIGAVTEGAIQPFVYNYKQEINSPYELTDALFNMAAGGIGQGLLSGAGYAIGKGFSKLIGKQELPDTHETRALKRDIQKLLELQHFADETGAKTVGELEIHLNALNKAMADIQAGRKVDYDSLGKTIEREYLELFDTEINGTRSTMDHIANLRHQLEQKFDADLHSKQEQLEQFGEQKLSPLELKRAKAKADTQTEGELNQETDLDTIREIQKNDWEKTVGEDTVRLNDEANKANNELRASRRDEGDMIAMKKELDDLDQQYSDAVEYHRAAKKARDVYVADKAEETSQAIKIAPTDTPRVRAVKDAVNRIVLSLGGQDIKVRVHEGNPEFTSLENIRYSRVSADEIMDDVPYLGDLSFLEGKVVRPTLADLTDAGTVYRGIDSSEVEAINLQGGPDFPFLKSSQLGEVVWASSGKSAPTRLKGSDYVVVAAMDAAAHKSNATNTHAIFDTVEAYVRDKRITKKNMKSINAHIRKVLKDFPGIENRRKFHGYVEGLTFEMRAKLVNQLASAKAQSLGAPNIDKILRKTVSKRYAGHNKGDALLLIKVDPDQPAVKLGENGTHVHESYEYGVKGKAVGRFHAGVSMETLFPDWVAERKALLAAEGKTATAAQDYRSFSLSLPKQTITKDIIGAIPTRPYKSIVSPRQLRLALDMAKGNWKDSNTSVKNGGMSPTDFANALKASDASASLTLYTDAEVKAGAKDGTMTAYQLGNSEVYFGLKRGYSYKDEYGIDHPDLGPDEVALVGVVNNEVSANGVGAPAVVLKAIEEGVTVLDAFAVKSKKHPNGFLPDTYARFGFEAIESIAFDPKYVTKQQLKDLKKLWADNGWNESDGYPDIVIMKWRGSDELRRNATQNFDRAGSEGFDSGAATGVTASATRADGYGVKQPTQDSLSGRVDGGDDGGQLRNGDGTRSSSRAHSAIREVLGLADSELKNLGVTRAEIEEVRAVLGERFSKSGDTIEAAINPETGELHINASAFRDEAHLMEVLREEVIGHYGLRKALGDNFQSVIDDIKATAMTNTELRQMWVELSGIDPQTKQVINPNAPYKGMADDVIADEIISKMARNEISDTTWLKLKSIIIKALRKIGLVKDDITISEMKALVVKSEQALKKNASKPATITGLKPQAKPNDEALHSEAVEAEAARVMNDETVEGVVFDENGNAVNFRDALIEDENEIAAIESVKVCML